MSLGEGVDRDANKLFDRLSWQILCPLLLAVGVPYMYRLTRVYRAFYQNRRTAFKFGRSIGDLFKQTGKFLQGCLSSVISVNGVMQVFAVPLKHEVPRLKPHIWVDDLLMTNTMLRWAVKRLAADIHKGMEFVSNSIEAVEG